MIIPLPNLNYNSNTVTQKKDYIPPFEVLPSGKVVITLSSSLIGDLLECNRKFHFRHIELIELNGVLKENTPIDLGTYWHSLMEMHYKKGAPLNGPEDLLIRAKHRADPLFSLNDEGYDQVWKAYVHYCLFEELGTIPKLVPFSDKSIEVGFSEILEETENYVFILTGRIDFLGYETGNKVLSVVDHKLQMRQRELYSHSVQFRNYSMVTKAMQFITNYVRLTKVPSFERQRILFSELDHQRWKKRVIRFYKDILRLEDPTLGFNNLINGDDPSACGGKFGFKCQYTSICEPLEPMDSSFVQKIKQAYFHKVQGNVSWRNEE